jgi:hypothetical protein
MRTWLYLLGGLLVWTAQFFGLYIVSSLFPHTVLARVLGGVLTLAGLAANAVLLRYAVGSLRSGEGEEVRRWTHYLAALGAAVSLVAVFLQGLPVILA